MRLIDACIRDGIELNDILRLKDVLKGMTCKTCCDHGMCAIEDIFHIKYCSGWENKNEV